MDTVVHTLSDEQIELLESSTRGAWLEMLEAKSFCDTVLQTEDGEKFIVHSSILSLCSPYFRRLFTSTRYTGPILDEDRKQFIIPGATADELKAIIYYAYTGLSIVTENNVTFLLVVADRFMVLDLIKDCCDFLSSNLTVQNCISVSEFAKSYYCFDLDKAAERFILSNFLEISETSKEYLELPLEKVVELLNSDRIHVRSEEEVWRAGIRWIDHRPEERSQYIDAIMRCVRLGLLNTQYFMENVKSHRYVESEKACIPIVTETLRFLWDIETMDQKAEEVITPSFAIPRIPHSVLFAIGGWSGGAPNGLIEAYDTKADRWEQIDACDPVGPRAYHRLAVIGHDIYVIGGFNGNDNFSSCRCFNVVTKEWRDIAPMHSKRCYVSVAVLDNLVYAMGGYDGHHRQNTAERYDYQINQWTYIAPMNLQRSDACATVLNGLIFIVGGFNGTECLASCECYNPATDQWTSITSMYQRRSGVSAISYHGKLYALGGFNGTSRLANGERFDPETEEWSEVPDMFHSRSNFAVEILEDMIFAIGGFNGVSTIFNVECFSDQRNEWIEATHMNNFRSALAACVVHGIPNIDDYIYQNRQGLFEEKRQRLIQQRNLERMRLAFATGPNFRPPELDGEEEHD